MTFLLFFRHLFPFDVVTSSCFSQLSHCHHEFSNDLELGTFSGEFCRAVALCKFSAADHIHAVLLVLSLLTTTGSAWK